MTRPLALTCLAAILVCACGTAPDGERDRAELAALQQGLAKAWLSGDRAALERIIAPDWTSTGPDGTSATRATVLAQVFETRVHTIHALEIADVSVRVFGDAAVVTGRTHGVGEFSGAKYDVVIRFTDTFVRRDGRWQAVASHASLVQPAPSGPPARRSAGSESHRPHAAA